MLPVTVSRDCPFLIVPSIFSYMYSLQINQIKIRSLPFTNYMYGMLLLRRSEETQLGVTCNDPTIQ